MFISGSETSAGAFYVMLDFSCKWTIYNLISYVNEENYMAFISYAKEEIFYFILYAKEVKYISLYHFWMKKNMTVHKEMKKKWLY